MLLMNALQVGIETLSPGVGGLLSLFSAKYPGPGFSGTRGHSAGSSASSMSFLASQPVNGLLVPGHGRWQLVRVGLGGRTASHSKLQG